LAISNLATPDNPPTDFINPPPIRPMFLPLPKPIRDDTAIRREQIDAQIFFLSGNAIEGKVYLDLPERSSRMSDFLNNSKAFFYLEVDNKDYLINSRLIKMVKHDP
jgi:hypothetical protein